MSEIAVRSGQRWSDMAGGREIPDQHIGRILTFLGSTAQEDLVHTNYAGGSRSLFADMEDIVEQLVLVGADGAGRRLRRRRFDVSADELIRDVDAIYLCEAQLDAELKLRYVVVDVRSEGDDPAQAYEAILLCRRSDFRAVHAHLGMGGSGGAIWRGAAVEDPEPILSVGEDDFVFAPETVEQLRRATVGFLHGDVADRLREWGVPAKHGVVLWGAPGNGKTLLTRLCAREALKAGMNVVIIEGRRRSRLSFDRGTAGLGDELKRAAARAPALVIFEDIDLHCEKRPESADSESAKQPEQQQSLAELLDFLDGIEPTEGYVLLTSTNDLERLDPALRRPGRIDLEIEIARPGSSQRQEALTRMIAKGPEPPPKTEQAAEFLDGASFADLAEVARRYKVAAAWAPEQDPGKHLEEVADGFMKERHTIDRNVAIDPSTTDPEDGR